MKQFFTMVAALLCLPGISFGEEPAVVGRTLAITFTSKEYGGTPMQLTGEVGAGTWNKISSPNSDAGFEFSASALVLTNGVASPWGFKTTAWGVGSGGTIPSLTDYGTNTAVTALFPENYVIGTGTTGNGGLIQCGSANNTGVDSTVTLSGLTKDVTYELSLLVGRKVNNVWAASATQIFSLNATGAKNVTTELIGAYVPASGGTVPSLVDGGNGFTCSCRNTSAGPWTCATFKFTSTGDDLVLNSTGGSNINALRLTQTSAPLTYSATVSADANWSEITWTGSDSSTTNVLADSAIATLTVENNATITFSNPISIDWLTVTGQTIFSSDFTSQSKFAAIGIPYRTSLIDANHFSAANLTTSLTGAENYTVTPIVSSTGISVEITAQETAKTRSININFPGGRNGNTNASGSRISEGSYAALNHGVYPVIGSNWNEIPAVNAAATSKSLKLLTKDDTVLSRPFTVTLAGVNNPYTVDATVVDHLFYGYCDDSQSPILTLAGLPFEKYRVVVYFATDTLNVAFEPSTINGVDYRGPSIGTTGGLTVKGTAPWGNSSAYLTTTGTMKEGVNYLVSDILTEKTVTVQNKNTNAGNARGGIAAVQIIEVGESNVIDFTAEVATGVNTWTGITNWSPSAFADGDANTATLTLADGTTAFTFDSSITADTVTFNGTTATAEPTVFSKDEAAALSVSTLNFLEMLNQTKVDFATGSAGIVAGADTILTQSGSGSLTIGNDKSATIQGAAWGGTIAGTGSLTLKDIISPITGLSLPVVTNIFSGTATTVNLTDSWSGPSRGSTLIFDGATLNSSSSTTILDPTAAQSNNSGSQPGFRFRSNSGGVIFRNGAKFSMPNGYLELGWDTGSDGNGSFNITGTDTKVSIRGIGAGNVFATNVPLNVSDNAVLEIGNMGLHHHNGNASQNLYTLNLNNGGILRATDNFDVESGIRIVLRGSNTLDAADKTITNAQTILDVTEAPGVLVVQGTTGSVVLSGSNTYTGGTVVKSGTLKVAGTSALGTGAVTLEGGTFDLTGLALTESPVIVNSVSATSPAKIIVQLTDSQLSSASPVKIVAAASTDNITVEVKTAAGTIFSEKGYLTAITDGVLTVTPKTVTPTPDGEQPSVEAESFIFEKAPETATTITVAGTTKDSTETIGATASAETAYALGIVPEFGTPVDGAVTGSFSYEFGITKLTPIAGGSDINFEAQIVVGTGSFDTVAEGDTVGNIILQGSADGASWTNLSTIPYVLTENIVVLDSATKTLTVKFNNVNIGQNVKFKVKCSK